MIRNRPRCPFCSRQLTRNGVVESSGKTRWRCRACGYTHTRSSQKKKTAALFNTFVHWLTSNKTLTEIVVDAGVTRQTLTKHFSQFWFVRVPRPVVTGVIHDQIFIDGTYVRDNCLLIARSSTHVIGWHWCRTETINDYLKLLESFPAPLMVVTDGNQAAITAVSKLWPKTRVQRCLVHIRRRVRQLISSKPRTSAGREIKTLANALTRVKTSEQAINWLQQLEKCHQKYRLWFNERTYRDRLLPGEQIPAYVRPDQKWWYTHQNTRKAFNLLQQTVVKKHLFAYIQFQESEGREFAATTNNVESINAVVKRKTDLHRGLKSEHLRCCIDWVLNSYTEFPHNPSQVAKTQEYGSKHITKARQLAAREQGIEAARLKTNDYHDPALIEEGLWVRKGWYGR